MADRIRFSTENLEEVGREILRLSDHLEDVVNGLAGVHLTKAAGGELKMRVNRNVGDGIRIFGSTAEEVLNSLRRATREVREDVNEIHRGVERTIEMFEDAEAENKKRFDREAVRKEGDRAIFYAGGTARPFDASKYKPISVRDFIKIVTDKAAADREQKEREIKQAYKEILRTSDDPINDPKLRELFMERLKLAGFTEKQAEKIFKKIQKAPETYRDMYIYSFCEYDIKNGSNGDAKGVYMPDENTMYVDADAFFTDGQMMEVFFHEAGHAIDFNSGTRTDHDGELFKQIERDTKDFIMEYIDDYGKKLTPTEKQEVLNAFMSGEWEEATLQTDWNPFNPKRKNAVADAPTYLSEEAQRVYEEVVQEAYSDLYWMPSGNDVIVGDVIPGMTNNVITSGGGHRKNDVGYDNYWFNPDGTRTGKECLEAWAEYHSSQFTGDSRAQNCNTEHLPNAVERMSEIAEERAEYFKTKAKLGQPEAVVQS